jgi:DNA polymerase-1
MEKTGFLVDRKALYDFGQSLTDGIAALQGQIWELAGGEFNINSPKQLGQVLFERLGLPAGKKTRTGWSTNADILEKLRDKHPIVAAVLEYRELAKLKSTYADGLLKTIGPDGRIHTSFQMTVTDTGRLSSREPNLQNIPVRRELGAGIRRMFVAGPGNVLVDADYSQIELRLLAHMAGDETMINAFQTGEDIHAVTASQVFGLPLEQVTPAQRSQAKAVNFGIVYGISAFSLSQDIGVSQPQAKSYIDTYMAKYHGVREYMARAIQEGKEAGYVSTLFGRRRYLPELTASNFNLRSFGERVARNMPIQGTAADVMKKAMIQVYQALERELPQAKLLLQVHDELIVECPAALADQAGAILRREMESVVSYSVPLTRDCGIGPSWAAAH